METIKQQVQSAPVTPAAPAPAAPAQPAAQAAPEVAKQQPDLLTRVSTPEAAKPTAPGEAPKVSVALDDIKDPVARKLVENRLEEANKKIMQTFGEVGADKSKLMKQVEELNSKLAASSTWTPQRLQQELNRPDFIQAAQYIQAQAAPPTWRGSQEEWSGLNEHEKAAISNATQETQALRQQMSQLLISQIDGSLRAKYPDYDPQKVNDFVTRAQSGSMSLDEIREYVHLGMNAKSYSDKAYQLGLTDRTVDVTEKINGLTPNTALNTQASPDKPTRQPGEHSRNFLSRLTSWNLDQIKQYGRSQRT